MTQRWSDTVFLHWGVDAGIARGLLPAGVLPDEREGRTYLGIVITGFEWSAVAGLRVPVFGAFPQLNLRLYTVDPWGRHGVHFLRMDAARAVPALAARLVGRLPYRWSSIRKSDAEGRLRWEVAATRWHRRVDVVPGDPISPTPMEEWLTSRWGLHARFHGVDYWMRVHHQPWTLRAVEVDSAEELLDYFGITWAQDVATRPLLGSSLVARLGWPERTLD